MAHERLGLATIRRPTINAATIAAAGTRRQPRKTRKDTKKERRMSPATRNRVSPFVSFRVFRGSVFSTMFSAVAVEIGGRGGPAKIGRQGIVV
jgi:hypothetical protein